MKVFSNLNLNKMKNKNNDEVPLWLLIPVLLFVILLYVVAYDILIAVLTVVLNYFYVFLILIFGYLYYIDKEGS
jgi:uncharacterized membrane protein